MLPVLLNYLLGLMLLALAASFLLFCIVFARGGRREDFLWRKLERRGRDADAVRQMRAGLDWYRSQTTQRWHIRSFDGTALAADFLPTPSSLRNISASRSTGSMYSDAIIRTDRECWEHSVPL